MERIPEVPGQQTPAELESANVAVETNAPRSDAAAVVPDPSIERVIVAVHGVGDQYSYATIQSVVNQFCGYYGDPAAVPLGSFHSGRPAYSVPAPPYRQALKPFAFAEVYWAKFPRKLVDEKHTLEESKKWARTIVERLRLRRAEEMEEERKRHDSETDARARRVALGRDADYGLLREVLAEAIQTIAVADRICSLAHKAGVFTFDLRALLDDYLGDVQVVTEFGTDRRDILDAFATIMTNVRHACPNATIHVVAHSEGTVVAFLGLLEAFRQSPAPDWTRAVRGFMTIGSPIDKHLMLWPHLFADPGKAKDPPAPGAVDPDPQAPRIQWRNYYDFGDPIAFALDDARKWIAWHGWGRVFAFDDAHDFGFTRYPLPGKAHVDYWDDEEVFGHFIQNVVLADGKSPTAGTKVYHEPRSVPWKQVVSYVVPYAGVAAVLLVACYILYKAVIGVIDPEDAEKARAAAQGKTESLRIAQRVGGMAALLLGGTALARLPRLARTAFWAAVAVAAGLAGGALYAWSLNDLEGTRLGRLSMLGVVTPAVALSIAALAAAFRWRVRTLIITGSVAVAGFAAYHVVRAPAHGGADGPLWPVIPATVAFLYLWWLGTLLFDLVFIWHLYIRNSRLMTRLHEIVGRPPDDPRREAARADAQAAV